MEKIIISAEISAPLSVVWDAWTMPQHIIHWNYAADDWHCPQAVSDFQEGGKFSYRMAARDESFAFDFWGTFMLIESNKKLEITLGDGRSWEVEFSEIENGVLLTEPFQPELENPIEIQELGWNMILQNFKKYAESVV